MLKTSAFYGLRQHLIIITAAILLAVPVLAPAREELAWNVLEPENTVYLQMQEGTAVILLNPDFAPKTVAHFKALLADQFYRGMSFYRVIDGFVAQGGDGSDIEPGEATTTLKAEFEIDWPLKPKDKEAAKNWQPLSWTPVQTDDLFAPFTGFIDGFPAARDKKKGGKAWLTHCPGTVAMARNEDPDSGNTDFYIVIGQAPRYLDRNLTVFGRVVWGMDAVQRIKRGPALENGIIEADLERTWIKRMRLASSMDQQELLDIWMADTNSQGFMDLLNERRNRKAAFFHHKPPKVLDVCQVPVPVRLEKRPSPRSLPQRK
ncbi:MAG: peptidylprolyl isomerase [Xanthomonadales bacterium]|nr:peptidylprolyl isomerase [Xanthomonadales bacterium]